MKSAVIPHPRTGIARVSALVLVIAVAASAQAAVAPEAKCEAGKNHAAGKYAACLAKAEKALVETGDAVKYGEALAKCESKALTGWTKLESAAVSAGTTCPSVGDDTAISDFVEACSTAVATAVGGGSLLQDVVTCNEDLGECTTSLDTCSDDLGSCSDDLDSCVDGLGFPLPRTSQVTCWDVDGNVISCAGSNQDGEDQAGAGRFFTDNGNGTITDNITKLMWEKLSDNGNIHDKDTNYTWANAAGKINTLNSTAFAGYTDWRLPNLRELQSILHYGANYGTSTPATYTVFHTGCTAGTCNGISCSCTRGDVHWTSSTYLPVPEAAWKFNFYDGDMYAGYKTDSEIVRAVRTVP